MPQPHPHTVIKPPHASFPPVDLAAGVADGVGRRPGLSGTGSGESDGVDAAGVGGGRCVVLALAAKRYLDGPGASVCRGVSAAAGVVASLALRR